MLIERLYPSSPVKLEQGDIDIILDACNALRNGSVTANDLWPGNKHDMQVLLSEKHTTNQAVNDLLTLRRTLRALERLQLSLRAKIHFTEKNVWPAVLHHGLEMLPDDVLLYILRLCYHIPGVDSYEGEDRSNTIVKSHEDVRRLAQVNKRFSSLVHHLPSLLTDKGELFSRIGNKTRTKEPYILGIPVVSGLHAVLFPSSMMWRSDTILRYVDKLRSIDSATYLSTLYSKKKAVITMPNLKSLRTDKVASFKGLHLPALQHLKIGKDLPRMLLPQLTSLSFKPEYIDTSKKMETLIETLMSASKLQQLQLDILFFGGRFLGFEWNRKISALPDLESLSLRIGFDCEKYTDLNVSMFVAAAAIVTSIDAPRLRHVGFDFYSMDDGEFCAACPWYEMFPPHRDYSNVQSVELSAEEPVAELYPGLLRALPHVKSLILGQACLEEDNGGIPELARLRELTLDDCEMNKHALERVLTRIFSQEEVNLERITINKAPCENSYKDHLCIPIGWDFLHEKLAKADENVYLDFS